MSRSLFLVWMVGGLCLVASAGAADEPQPRPHMKMVSIEVVIADYSGGKVDEGEKTQTVENPAERLKLLEKQGRVGSVARIRLSTLDQLPAMVQIGERAPVVAARSRQSAGFPERAGSGGGFNSTFSMQNFGTLVNVTPRVEENGTIVVTLELERSRLLPPPPAPENASANEEGIPRTSIVMAKTSVRVPPGQSVMVSGAKTNAREESGELLILVSARVVDTPNVKQTGADASGQQIKVFTLVNTKAASASESISKIMKNTADIRVSIDQRTNSIIAHGSTDALATLEALLTKLDAAP